MAQTFSPRFVDLVRNYTTTVGTTDFALGPVVNGYSSFAEALNVGDRFYYSCVGVDKPAEREVGRGTFTDKGTILREPISGTMTNFSKGSKSIALIAASEWFEQAEGMKEAVAGLGSAANEAADHFAASAADCQALAALPRSGSAVLREAGREGLFTWDWSDLSAKVAADPAQGVFIAPASDKSGASGAWVRKFDGPVNLGWFGLIEGDNSANGQANSAAFSALQSVLLARRTSTVSAYSGLERVRIPSGTYWFADNGSGAAIEIFCPVILEGHSVGYNSISPLLKFPTGVTGIRTHDRQTTGAFGKLPAARAYGAQGTVLRNLALLGAFTSTEAEAHGIQARTTTVCENVSCNQFEGNGFHFAAGSGAADGANPPYGNVNVSKLINCTANNNRNGLRMDGMDANACTVANFNHNNNRQAGIYDTSLIGNYYDGGQSAGNGLNGNNGATIPASVVSDGTNRYFVIAGQEAGASVNAPSGTSADNVWWAYYGAGGSNGNIPLWVSGISVRAGGPVLATTLTQTNAVYSGIYTESLGQPPAQIWQSQLVVGGTLAAKCYQNPTTSHGTAILSATTNGQVQIAPAARIVSGTVVATMGGGQGNPSTIIWSGTEPTYAPTGYQCRYANLGGGALLLTYGNQTAPAGYVMYVTGPNTTDQFGTGAACPQVAYLPRLALGSSISLGPSIARVISVDNAAPASGAHGQGEFCFYRGATAGLIGWHCTAAGTPGTWEALYTGYGTSPIGYTAGGAAVQATSKSAAVTVNKLSGQITTNAASLAAGAIATFSVTNSQVAATDTVNLNLASGNAGAGSYRYWVEAVAAGSFKVSIENRSAAALAEALVFNFAIVKAAAA